MVPSNKNIHSLHIIRGIAALLVVIYHSKYILWAGGTLWKENAGFKNIFDYLLFFTDMLSSCGMQCVIIFFLLSGFVIYHSFQHSDRSIKHFFIIRGVRIYIPFLFSLALSVTVLYFAVQLQSKIAVNDAKEFSSRILTAYNEINFTTIAKTVFFLPSGEYAGLNFAYWSLLHEAIFYLLFPIYFYAGSRNRGVIFILFLIGFLLTKNKVLYFQLYFLIGMFLYDYYGKARDLIFKKQFIYIPLILVIFCAVNVLEKLSYFIGADVVTIFLGVLCFDYLLVKKPIHNQYFKKLSDMSFTLYLNHVWVLLICYLVHYWYFKRYFSYERYPYYLGVIISLSVSWFLYNLVEKKSLALISSIKLRWKVKKIS